MGEYDVFFRVDGPVFFFFFVGIPAVGMIAFLEVAAIFGKEEELVLKPAAASGVDEDAEVDGGGVGAAGCQLLDAVGAAFGDDQVGVGSVGGLGIVVLAVVSFLWLRMPLRLYLVL